jgi:hypothetical protein
MYRSRPAAIPASMAGICAALDRKEGAPQAASEKLGTSIISAYHIIWDRVIM